MRSMFPALNFSLTALALMAMTTSPSMAMDKKEGLSGSVEGGLAYATGNSEKEDINAAATIGYRKGIWEHQVKAKAINSSSNDVRTEETYRADLKSTADLSEKDYVFGEVEYVNDRFSGYDYRTSEVVGYGRHLIDNDTMSLTAELGVGARQDKFTTGDHDDSWLIKPGADFEWKISDTATFTESLDVAIAENSTVTNSETALKVQVYEQLFLKAGFDVEHISDVPAGRENTDTLSTLNLVYDF